MVAKNTQISFIVTSKVLYNLKAQEFRNQFLNQFQINHILELSSVRKEVFVGVKVPVSLIFYECAKEDEIQKNEINYISMKPNPYFKKLKILMLSKADFKKVSQKKLIENDYLWKILVYGSYLDFNFIKRLKQFDMIQDYIQSSNEGIMIGGGDKNSTDEYHNISFIETKQIEPFFINTTLEPLNRSS